MRPLVRVVTGAEAAAQDATTIAARVPSRALMQRAGAAAAAEITIRFPDLIERGVLVLAGPGNNGSDGWVIARALGSAGVDVNVISPAGAKSPDCVAEREIALRVAREVSAYSGEGVIVDALLGTGSSGAPRGEIDAALGIGRLGAKRGAAIVAIDLPSGLDADTGADNGVLPADLTLTFGNFKRGHVVGRGACGVIVSLDIGLLVIPSDARDLLFADAHWVRDHITQFGADAHKGTRKKLLIQGGAPGMAGAVILGLRAALASGIGMVKARVHPDSVNAIHGAVPATLIEAWSDDDTKDTWADVLVIGPGFGVGPDARAAVERALKRHTSFTVMDADALTAFAGDLPGLKRALGGRPSLITPHPAECARLMGVDVQAVLDRRFDIGLELAREIESTVLLKGVPTVVSTFGGERIVVAAGTPALATGGSGDLLAGIAGALFAQTEFPFAAAACAAWIHGRAAQLAGAFVRGTTLEEVLEMLPNAWRIPDESLRYPIIAELPAVPTQ